MMAVNHERQKVWAEVTTVDLDYATLAEAITKLQGYCAQYGDTARIQIRDRDYGDGEYWAVMQERDETDGEMIQRITQEARRDAEQAIRDRAEFERLKAKFGG